MITKIRQEFSAHEMAPDLKTILAETNVLDILSQILGLDDAQSELVRFLKLEATWVLTNIGYGDEEDILQIFKEEHRFVNHINRILQGNDLQMIDQVIWLVSNCCGESQAIHSIVIRKIFIIDALARIIFEA